MTRRIGPCPCGSGKMYKRCCGAIEEQKAINTSQTNKIYYHATSMTFGNNIIPPGNWWRIVQRYVNPDVGELKKLIIEQTFEKIRLQYYPEKPSRQKSVFLFEEIEPAREFIKEFKRQQDSIYEVEIINKNCKFHKGHIKAVDTPKPELPFITTLEQIAKIYWECSQTEFAEIIVESPVKIVKKCE